MALGTSSNRHIRDTVLSRCHGPDEYKEAWKTEVEPRVGKGLAAVVTNWQYVKTEAYPLRNQVIHGTRGMPSSRKTQERVEAFLEASQCISEFALTQGVPLFGQRLPVRRKPRS